MKNLKLLSILFIALFAFTSCGDDDDNNDDNNNPENSFTFDGDEYELKSGIIEYYGSWDDPNVYNFDITLATTEVSMVNGEFVPEDNIYSEVYFEMWTDNATDLAIGDYEYSNNETAGTFSEADIVIDSNYEEQTEGTYYYINSGTVQILENGSGTYEIVFDCMTMNDMEVSGTYEGTLFTEDVTGRHSNEKPASKKMLLTKKK